MGQCTEIKTTYNLNPNYVPPSSCKAQAEKIDFKTMEGDAKRVNSIIFWAIEHGGDAGGAYYSCPKELKSAIQDWLDYHHYNKYCKISNDSNCLIEFCDRVFI